LAERRATAAVIVALSAAGIAVATGLFGPFVYVPSLCAANVVTFAAGVDIRLRRFALACGVVAPLVPPGPGPFGIPQASRSFVDNQITLLPRALDFPAGRTTIVLALETLGTLLLPALLVGAERDARVAAERKLAIQAHQFAEFVPREVKPGAA